MTLRRAMLALAALPLAAAMLPAQHDVRGTVVDSTLARGALHGAEVLVLGTSRTAATDEQGRFILRGLPAGRFEIVVVHALFDTLGLGELSRDVDVGAATPPLVFSTPSLAAYQAERCGRALAPHEAIIVGTVRTADGAEAPGASVTARWAERTVARGESTQRERVVVDTVDESGRYALCGVPREPALLDVGNGAVTARSTITFDAQASDGAATGTLTRGALEQDVARHELVVGGTQVVAEVRGRVIDAEGKPVAGARVTRPRADASTTTDSSGRFTMRGVPQRTEQLLVRAVGLEPAIVELSPYESRYDAGDVTLMQTVFTLGTVNVTAGAMTPERAAFEDRRKFGMGTHLDDEELKRQPRVTKEFVASRTLGARMIKVGISYIFAFERLTLSDSGFCMPRYFIDGMDIGVPTEPGEVDAYFNMAVRIEVYSAAKAPARYNDFDGCGVVLIWTR